MHDLYPGASAFTDRHGKRRWRFRRKGKTITLPGQPGDAAFDAAYQAALTGREPPRAQIRRLPGATVAKSIGDAWRRTQQSPAWLALDAATRALYIRYAEEFLDTPLSAEHSITWREVPMRDLRRRHLKDIIAAHQATPHKAKHLLTAIRKMIETALDEEWIELDPSYKLKYRPTLKGWKAWSIESIRQFEAHWQPGSNARLAYALALWLGNRRSDVVSVRWSDRTVRQIQLASGPRLVDGFLIEQEKTGKQLFLPVPPMLAELLELTPRNGGTVLLTAYGKPYSAKALTTRMADWTREAGLPPGHTLHGLRKTLGKWLAEGGASTRQLMEVLGHDDIAHAELYSREAEQALLATEGMDKVVALHRRRGG